MPRGRAKQLKSVETLTYEEARRRNLPSAEHQPLMREEEQSPVRVAYERRNRDLDPQLVWRGKDQQDRSDLVVNAPPLYIQERVHPKILVDDLMRESRNGRRPDEYQTDMFADFNGLPSEDAKTEFYQHDANWSNRMILGDSLRVMSSLAEREGLRGKMQCIYIDPPYGIRFNSNFQWSTTSRDVRDGNAAHITREPEQVRAFRDTWRDGIHSYLTYLRDRLTVARDLLAESGSIFVQIGDENVYRVRALMDEVFGQDNHVADVVVLKTSSQTSQYLAGIADYVVWYASNKQSLKYRQPYRVKELGQAGTTQYVWELSPDLRESRIAKGRNPSGHVFAADNLASQSGGATTRFEFRVSGKQFRVARGGWKTNLLGMTRLYKAYRLKPIGNSLMYRRFLDDFSVYPIANVWDDVLATGFSEQKVYVVQSSQKLVERCLLMTTDPGDLVLDPTCGSGTTAYMAEQLGRRWITVDTSRVALALARARIMGARYPYYLLSDSRDGQVKQAEVERRTTPDSPTYGDIRQGFVHERVPHITLKAIANNSEIDVIWEDAQEDLEPLREELNHVLGVSWEEWQIPREAEEAWPDEAKRLHAQWWERRIARQKDTDASIAGKADYEYLYDKPYEDRRKVRVAGPFTVESISPHRVLGVDEKGNIIAESTNGYGGEYDFGQVMLDNLRTAGVQQAHREDRIEFSSITPWPGQLVCADGRYVEGGGEDGVERRAAIFIGPEFGTVSRPDLVRAAREAADSGFDVLIACAFNYEAHTTEFESLGRVPVLKARMNPDLHMAGDLKNTGKGNLFVIFGEPDVTVASGQWLVTRSGSKVANYDDAKELSGLGSLEEINRIGRDGLSNLCAFSAGGEIRPDQSGPTGGGVSVGEYSGGSGTPRDRGVSPVSWDSQRLVGRDRDLPDSGAAAGTDHLRADRDSDVPSIRRWTHAQRTQTPAAVQALTDTDFPLSLTTNNYSQVTVHGVDVFHPNTGEIRSDGPEGIACWFIDTDYNEEAFFVRHAYFLGASDPYKSLKTTLRAEIDADAWASLHSDTSRPFNKPDSGRIAVKVINHLGDEVLKVFRIE